MTLELQTEIKVRADQKKSILQSHDAPGAPDGDQEKTAKNKAQTKKKKSKKGNKND